MASLRVCFVGDSITAGTGDTAFLGWPGRLCAAEVARGHDLTEYNLGIRGDTSGEVSSRWQTECEARLPCEKGLIATYLGMERESFSRALKKLRTVGVNTKGRCIQIQDPDALKRFSVSAA